MPANKDFKRLIRARMHKTGEAYTTARARLLRSKPILTKAAAVPVALPSEYAVLAGMSDAAVKSKTGCTWERWVNALDYVKAHTWSHRTIAEYVHDKYHVPGWWSQTVTVGYERIKGLRAVGQRRDGGFEVTKSKVFAVPLGRLYRAFRDPRTRGRWLPGVKFTIRTATPNKSMRVTWPDGTSVELYFTTKGATKSHVQIEHRRLADRAAAAQVRGDWAERLATLDTVLTR